MANSKQQLEITVKRINGAIEVIIHPALKFITRTQFEQMRVDTKAAGRGEVLSYRILRDGRPIVLASNLGTKGNFERGLKDALKNPGTAEIEQMSAMGE